MGLNGIIFDVDGTLVNSIPLHFKAWKSTLKHYDISKTDDEIYYHFGKTPLESAYAYTEGLSQISAKEVMEYKTQYFLKHIHEIIIFPGIKQLFHELKEREIQFTLASNGSRRTIRKMVENFDFLSRCKGVIAYEDVQNSKPHPEMIEKSLSLLNIDPSAVIMVGDSVYDIQAAQEIPLRTIFISSSLEEARSSEIHPDYTIGNIHDLINLIIQGNL